MCSHLKANSFAFPCLVKCIGKIKVNTNVKVRVMVKEKVNKNVKVRVMVKETKYDKGNKIQPICDN